VCLVVCVFDMLAVHWLVRTAIMIVVKIDEVDDEVDDVEESHVDVHVTEFMLCCCLLLLLSPACFSCG